jgi:hypothetical protein
VIVAIVFLALRAFLRELPADKLPIQQLSFNGFPTLAYPLANAKLVVLYFGASYCEENRLLRDSFLRDERLLPQEGLHISEKSELAVVYISSDDVEGSSQWIHVNDKTEKRALKS